jgi:epsilon-lactone hydrolase
MRAAIPVLGVAIVLAASASAQTQPTMPKFDADGTVRVPAFELPPSSFSSEEAKAQQRMRARMPAAIATSQEPDIATRRAQIEAMMSSRIALMNRLFPVDVADGKIAGVPVKTFTPKGKAPVKDRLLINLHGGGFTVCWPGCAYLESIPLAGLGGYTVISLDYRMGPEARHPAGVEDVAMVWRELIKTHKPSQIGIYGCSAGGSLTAQTAAWLPANGLPQAGAVGIFGAGAARFETGDSTYIAGAIDGSFGPPPKPGEKRADMTRGYFADADQDGPVLSAAKHPDVLAKFPPTMIVTGTRAMDMSPAIVTNSALLKAGVKSTLIVGEAMGHCYIYAPDLPESRDAYAAILAFFRDNLKD